MLTRAALLGIALLGLTGCGSSDQREWMKVNEKYTVAEFQRDHAACSKGGKLDDACMRTKGWVDVSKKVEKAPEPPPVPATPSRY